ncbi:MAG: hypothetical protein ACAH12_05000 [Methylophilaceae bacterium]
MQNKSGTSESLRQRRAVYHGLCSVLSEEDAATALDMWTEHSKASQSVFSGLNMYVREVCTKFGKTDVQREMAQAINRALMAKPADLIALPTGEAVETIVVDEVAVKAVPERAAVATAVVTNGAASEGANNTPEFQTFKILILALFELVDQHSATTGLEFRDFVKDVVTHLPWSEAQQEQLVVLVDTGSTIQTRAYRAGQLKALLGHIKSWLADNMGGAAGALAIEQAMAVAAKSVFGQEYAPKSFL